MKKHFLVTISNDIDNLFGVQFITSFFKKVSEHQLTLLHINRLNSNVMEKTLGEMWRNPEIADKNQEYQAAQRSFDKVLTLLKQNNMSIEQMITKTVTERYGKVKDILTEGSKGLYDAIILGRRASYTMQWVFERPGDKTAQTMIKDSCFTLPVWICPEPDLTRKNILLCLDGSKNAYRTVDHVGYILSAQDQHTITLFHVENGTGTTSSSEIFQRAEKILKEHAIDSNRVNTQTTWGLSVPGTILNELKKEQYAAVAVGLHGEGKSILKNFKLAGDTTSKLINRLENTSLCCCP